MHRILLGLMLVSLPMSDVQGIPIKDIFGRVLNDGVITVVDWDGYMANPAIRFLVCPPTGARFPATAVLTADTLGGTSTFPAPLAQTAQPRRSTSTIPFPYPYIWATRPIVTPSMATFD